MTNTELKKLKTEHFGFDDMVSIIGIYQPINFDRFSRIVVTIYKGKKVYLWTNSTKVQKLAWNLWRDRKIRYKQVSCIEFNAGYSYDSCHDSSLKDTRVGKIFIKKIKTNNGIYEPKRTKKIKKTL